MSMEVVNGYVCRNCTDVSNAKRSIDPAHPKDGPNGVDAPASRQSVKAQTAEKADEPSKVADRGPAVVLGGQFANAASDVSKVTPAPKDEAPRCTPGSTVNIAA